MASVKVAVRVRPFNQREIDLNSNAIIRMDGQKTAIINTKIDWTQNEDGISVDKLKEFTFDYSYWSFDRYDPGFASQELVYKDLGADVVSDAFEGYNSCIFAYGQTGSGKTYTMMGTPDCEGLIPRICQELFAQMKTGRTSATFRTEVSYLEIYNEHVKDLLSKNCHKQNLRVREHPKLGPYVQDLSKHLVQDYSDLRELMNKGNAHRTTAATNMNDTSSRSHAIFTIAFSMASFSGNSPRETLSKINLVDLAGSERATSTKAEGQRLIEGGHINKSLVTLGSVISALAEMCSNPKKKQCFIPYRDSVLTWLLKDSLGGNSKTIMIAAISPADCNYSETLCTLRYANRAKNIINKPTINEDSNTKLIRELRSEIERLRSMIGDCPTMIEKLHENEARVKVLTEEWTEKWKETHKILKEQRTLGLRRSGFGIVLDSELPHLIGIDDDVLSTGITLYHLKEGKTTIGTEYADSKQDIVLCNGVGIEDEHCFIELKDGIATLVPLEKAVCFVNTIEIDKPTRLSQGCVIVLGQNIMFRFNDPIEVERMRKEKEKGSCLNLSKIFSRSSDFSKSYDSLMQETINNELDSYGIKINEKRKLIEDLEKEYKIAEEKRRAEQLNADQQLIEKRLELERLKAESEKLRNIIEESQLIIKNNEGVMNLCIKPSDETQSLSEMLSIMKDKTQDAKGRVSEILSTITTNALNRKESLTQKSVLLSIYETLTQQIEQMGLQNIITTNDTNSLVYKQNNLNDNINNGPDLPNNAFDAQTINNNKCNINDIFNNNLCSGDFDNRLSDSRCNDVKDLVPIRNDFEKVLIISDELNGNQSSNIDSVINLRCDENSNIEANLIEIRLNELQQSFEKHIKDLQNKFDLQRLSFEDQRNHEMEKLINERKRLQELEDANISALVEREVQRRLNLQQNDFENWWRNDLESCLSKHFTSSPISHSRSLYSIPSLSNIIENSFESSIGSKQTTGEDIPPNTIVIIIPSFSLRGSGFEEHFEYEIKINVNGEKWTIFRRYKRFYELNQYMKEKYGHKVHLPYFPPKKWFNKSEKVVESRRKLLERYLQELVKVCQTINSCPLNYKAFGFDELTKDCLLEFSQFFHKGCFELNKHFTA